MSVSKKSIQILIAFQMAASSAFAAPGDKPIIPPKEITAADRAVVAAQNRAEDLVAELSQADENTAPKNVSDPFHMKDQVLTKTNLRTGQVETLSMNSLVLPDIFVKDFDNTVTISSDAATSSLKISYKQGNTEFAQVIPGLKVITQARNKKIFFFITEDRRMMTLDMTMLKDVLFRSIVPVFPVGELGPDVDLKDIKADFQNRGLKPADYRVENDFAVDLSDAEKKDAENVLLYKDEADGRRREVGVLDKAPLYKTLAFGEKALYTMAMMNRQVEQSQITALKDLPPEAQEVQKTSQLAQDLDPQILDFLTTAPKELIESLISQAKQNTAEPYRIQDKFTQGENKSEVARFRATAEKLLKNPELMKIKATKEAEDLGQSSLSKVAIEEALTKNNFQNIWRTLDQVERDQAAETPYKTSQLFREVLNIKNLRLMGALVVTGIAVHGINHATGGAPQIWATHVFNSAFDSAIKVFSDVHYRWTFLKYAVSTSMIIPAIWAASALTSKHINVTWDYKQTWATMGARISAYTDLPFYHYLAQMARQPNFMRALRLGINPFKKIKTETESGRAGIINPFQSNENFKAEVQRKAQLLDTEAKRKMRAEALSTALAFSLAAQETKTDPATLMLLSENGKVTQEGIEALYKISENPELQKKWMQYAEETSNSLAQAGHGEAKTDLKEVSPEYREDVFKSAMETAEALNKAKANRSFLENMKVRYRSVGTKTLSGIGNYALPQYRVLRTESLSKFQSAQAWKEFVMDIGMHIWEGGLWGKKADLSKPENLPAKEGGFLWASDKELSNFGNQVATFSAKVPGHVLLIFRSKRKVIDKAFDPIEEQSLMGVNKTDGFLSGMYTWIKDVANIPKARHGATILKTFTTRALTYQGAFVLMAATRLASGAQAASHVLQGFLYYQWKQYPTASIYMTMANRGNQMYDERIEHLAESFSDAKTKLGQGLRMNDNEMVSLGYKELAELYKNSKNEIPQDIMMNLEHADKVFEIVSEGNVEKITQMQERARTLLDFALTTPPFATRKNEMIDFVTFFGALSARTILSVSAVMLSLDTKIPWTTKLADAALTATAIIGGLYVAEKVVIWGLNKRTEMAAKAKALFTGKKGTAETSETNKRPHGAVGSCSALFSY